MAPSSWVLKRDFLGGAFQLHSWMSDRNYISFEHALTHNVYRKTHWWAASRPKCKLYYNQSKALIRWNWHWSHLSSELAPRTRWLQTYLLAVCWAAYREAMLVQALFRTPEQALPQPLLSTCLPNTICHVRQSIHSFQD